MRENWEAGGRRLTFHPLERIVFGRECAIGDVNGASCVNVVPLRLTASSNRPLLRFVADARGITLIG
jgi:hypothetical protein